MLTEMEVPMLAWGTGISCPEVDINTHDIYVLVLVIGTDF